MISALVIRRFNTRENGAAVNVEVAGLVDVAVLPNHGTLLCFEDGTGEASVVTTRLRAWPSPRPPGVYPSSLEIRTSTEPGSRLEGVLATPGWKRRQAA